MLTLQGSDPLNISYGTLYPSLMNSNIEDPTYVEEVVKDSVASASDQMIALDTINNPSTDEKFYSAEIVALTVGADSMNVTVLVRNVDNKAAKLVLFSGLIL